MADQKSRRITCSLPPNAVEQLDFVASRLHCTRSALLSQMLVQSLPAMVELASCLPEDLTAATGDDVRRLRGASAEIIGKQVSRLLTGAQDDLFS